MTKSITVPTGWKAPSSGGSGGAVTSVDGRTGVVVLTDRYTNKTGDTMTGLLTVPKFQSTTAATDSPLLQGAILTSTNTASVTSATSTTTIGGTFGSYKNGAGDWTNSVLTGARADARNMSAGAVGNVTGLEIFHGGQASHGAITTSMGISIPGPLGTGTIGTSRGVTIAAQARAGVTTAYGILQSGAADLNYFNGNVGLGQLAPTSRLHFTADTTAAGGIAFGVDTNLYRSAAGVLKTDGRLDTNAVRVGLVPSGLPSAVDLGVSGPHRDRSTFSNLSIVSTDAQAIDKGGSISLGGSYTDAGAVTPYAHIAAGKHSGVTGEFGGYLTLGTRPQGGSMTERLRITEAGLVQAFGSLALGATPPATGAVRLTAGTTAAEGIQFGADTNLYRSAAGVLKTDGAIAVGAGNVATTGLIRAPVNTTIVAARNFTNAADLDVLGTDNSNGTILSCPTAAFIRLKNGTVSVMTIGAAFITLADGKHFTLGTTNGTKFGSAPTEKLAFWNATPVVQPAGTPAAATDAATTQALVNDIRTKLMTIGLIA